MKSSVTNALVFIVIGLLVGGVVTYFAIGTTSTSTSTPTLSGTIKIGYLADLTGSYGSAGLDGKIMGTLALNSINSWLAASGRNVQFNFTVDDDGTNPSTALTNLQSMQSQGIQVIVGPETSLEVGNVLSYADSNHIVLISPQSSSIAYTNRTNSYLFRTVPPDSTTGYGEAALVAAKGFNTVVLVYRNDQWGSPISQEFLAGWSALHGNLAGEVSYTPTTGSYDFGPQLATIQTDYQAGVNQHGANSTAIVVLGLDETATILTQMQSEYPSLLQAFWFTSQGYTFSTTAASIGPLAIQTGGMLGNAVVPSNSSILTNVVGEFQKAYGRVPNLFSVFDYDSVWIAALSILACNANSATCVQSILPTVASHYYGVTGWTVLDNHGDRSKLNEQIFGIAYINGAYVWASYGVLNTDTNAVVWYPKAVAVG